MSSILKALEKVEDSRSTRGSGGVSGLARRRERRPVWIVPTAVLGGAAVAALLTFAAMGGFSSRALPARAVKAGPGTATLSAPPLATVIESQPIKPERGAAAKKGNSVAASTAKRPSAAALSAKGKVPSAVSARHDVARNSSEQAPSQERSVPAVARQHPAADKVRPDLKVTGIAWQKDAESSAAIINGRPLLQGGVVDGYKVEEIFPDKVRFSGSSGSIEVPLGGGE
jgi:general secretion pathway protein B